MPGTHPPVTLHLDLRALPAVRAAFEDALTDLARQLARLTRGGFIPEPWLGDPISGAVHAHYNATVMEASDGPLSALFAYQEELVRIRDNLKAMEDNYLRADANIAAQATRLL